MTLDSIIHETRYTFNGEGPLPHWVIGIAAPHSRDSRSGAIHLCIPSNEHDGWLAMCGTGDVSERDTVETANLNVVNCGNCRRMINRMERDADADK